MINILKKYGEILEEHSLKSLNTYHIGGIAKYIISPYSIKDLIETLRLLKENNIKYFVLGNGSNVVLNDQYFDGAVIRLNKLNGIEIHPELQMAYAEAGAMLPKLVIESIKESLTGLEFAAAIPGTIGGSIYGNAGAYSSCIMDYVTSVTVLDENLEIKTLEHEEIEYGYRHTMFKNKKYIILAAKFFLKKGDKENSMTIIDDRNKKRRESQPIEYPSAGSVFRNPEGDYAGRLIEACGLKGIINGGAQVAEKHANFIINKNNATSKEVHDLIEKVHDTVLEKTNVDLIREQEYIGWE